MTKYQSEEVQQAFKFHVPLQVRFSDIDGYMHVNNGVYFNFLEHARALYLHQVCQWDFSTIGAVVGNINLDFYQPINFFDELQAYVRCVCLGTTSFTLEQVLMGKKTARQCRCVCRNFGNDGNDRHANDEAFTPTR